MLPLLAFALPFLAQWFEREPLQPYEARSASGAWVLEVRPTDPDGTGPMHARILHGAEVSWSGQFAWTFEQAGVSEDGTCVGYRNGEKLGIAVLDAKGAVRKEHAIEHTTFLVDGPDLPMASGPVLVLSSADLALIRVEPADQSRPAPWRAFRLSSGETQPDIRPDEPVRVTENEGVYERGASVVGDTGLVLTHWWYADYRRIDLAWPKEGGVFALHDLQGHVVWSSFLPDDYTDRTSEKADDELERALDDAALIVSAGPGPRFAVRHVKENARVEYAVEKDASGAWSVKEVARAPWTDEKPAAPPIAVETITLVEAGRASLRSGPRRAKDPIHDVMQLGFTAAGELELLRREEGSGPSYARFKQDGTLVFERDLTPVLPRKDAWPSYHELTGDRWLLQFDDDELPWLVLDVRTGETMPAPLPNGGLGSHVAPFDDGSYVAVVDRVVRYTAVKELYRVAADGSVVWSKSVDGLGPDEDAFTRAVYFAQGVARTGKRTFALLSMSEIVQVDLDQKVLATWKLEDVLGHDPGYMDGVLADAKGGLIFEEGDRFHHLDARGTEIGTFLPRRLDGSRDSSMNYLLRVAPDGRMWTSDRQRVYRLDEQGVADLVLGPEPRDDELAEVGQCAIDVLGRALVQDAGTRAVHVFDAEGKPLALCRLAPKERPEEYVSEAFRGTKDGSVWVTTQEGLARFDAAGTRIPPAKDSARDWKREDMDALDPQRRALEAMKQRPDGTWLSGVLARTLFPDGRRVLLERVGSEGGTTALHFYTASGEPLHTLAIPAEADQRELSVGPRWIVIDEEGPSWTLVRIEDEKLFRCTTGIDGVFGQTPDGKLLLVLDSQRLELARYELP